MERITGVLNYMLKDHTLVVVEKITYQLQHLQQSIPERRPQCEDRQI